MERVVCCTYIRLHNYSFLNINFKWKNILSRTNMLVKGILQGPTAVWDFGIGAGADGRADSGSLLSDHFVAHKRMEVKCDFILHSVRRQKKVGSGDFIGKPKSALMRLQVKILHNMLLIITRGGK